MFELGGIFAIKSQCKFARRSFTVVLYSFNPANNLFSVIFVTHERQIQAGEALHALNNRPSFTCEVRVVAPMIGVEF